MQNVNLRNSLELVLIVFVLVLISGCTMKTGYNLQIYVGAPTPEPIYTFRYGDIVFVTGYAEWTNERLNISWWKKSDPANKTYKVVYSSDNGLFNFNLIPPEFGTQPGEYVIQVVDVSGKNATDEWVVAGMKVQSLVKL